MPVVLPVGVLAIFLPFAFLIDKVLLAVFGLLTLVFAAYIGSVRCPVCRKRLGMFAIRLRNGRLTGPPHCPRYHVSIDEPMPEVQDDRGQ